MPIEYMSLPDKIVVVLGDAALIFLHDHRQSRYSRERGGQLFADVLRPHHVNIVEATLTPGLWHRPFGYKPDIGLQQLEIKAKYDEGLHYVGDWHTHPQAVPGPSPSDERYMQDLVQLSKGSLRYFIMAIVGTAPQPQGIYVAMHDHMAYHQLERNHGS